LREDHVDVVRDLPWHAISVLPDRFFLERFFPERKDAMQAVRLHPPGGSNGLFLEEVDVPQPDAGEVLVRVHAAAITRDELDWTADRLPATPSFEFSGVVAVVGPKVDTVTSGEAVYALSWGAREGAAAEYTLVPAEFLAPKPKTLGHTASAAIPLAALSAWQGLFDHGKLAEGDRVLIHGAAGGVGHFAVQLARGRGARSMEQGKRGKVVLRIADD
jgi:NADPH:quinone reductase-like Zn-dependent oxidoreductase